MAALSVTSIYPAMLRTSDQQHLKPTWAPEEEAVVKKPEEQPQDDSSSSSSSSSPSSPSPDAAAATSGTKDFVAVRVSRSQSLTDPKTPPMFPSPTNNSTLSPIGSVSGFADETLIQPLSEPERGTAQSNLITQLNGSGPPPLVSPEQLANDPRFARRNRRSMSAEFTLSMLQLELGYPKRKSLSKSRRDSIEKSRRTSSILEEEEHFAVVVSPVSASGNGVRSNPSSEDSSESTSAEPEPERSMSRHSIESAAAKYPSSGNASTRRGSYASTQDTHYGDEDTNNDDDDDDDDDEEEENFLDSRVASITGFSQDTDGVVYYEILVKSVAHGPLSAYKVRRRYSEFRELHRSLSAVMPTSRSVNLVAPLGLSDDDERIEASISTPPQPSRPGVSTVPARAYHLPPLPDRGGLWAYLQFDTTPFLERRAKYFQALLVACQHHPRARASRLLNEFLGPPPDSVALHTSVENSYVSLNRFAAPKLRLSVEAQERKQKARNISRRRSSVPRISRSNLES